MSQQISYETLYEIDDAEADVWDDDGYGYADDFLGDEEWEDQAGMLELKRSMRIPEDWYLVKCVNFDRSKLTTMEAWLAENCSSEYKRVGWSSGCSTKVGVAFAGAADATFFKLRWI